MATIRFVRIRYRVGRLGICSKGGTTLPSVLIGYLEHGAETTLLPHPADIIANLAQSHRLGTGLRGVTSWKSARLSAVIPQRYTKDLQ